MTDTQAPERIGTTIGIDFGTGKETTMLTLMIDGELHHASTDGPWGKAMLALLAERDLASAQTAAAVMQMREDAAADVAQFGRLFLSNGDDVTVDVLHDIRALPLPDTAALDALIAERVREARNTAWDEAADIMDGYGQHGYAEEFRGRICATRASKEGR